MTPLASVGEDSQSNHRNWWVHNSSRGKASSQVRAQPKTSSKIAHSRLVFTTGCRGPSVSALLFKNLFLLGLLKVAVRRKSLQKKHRDCGGVGYLLLYAKTRLLEKQRQWLFLVPRWHTELHSHTLNTVEEVWRRI